MEEQAGLHGQMQPGLGLRVLTGMGAGKDSRNSKALRESFGGLDFNKC